MSKVSIRPALAAALLAASAAPAWADAPAAAATPAPPARFVPADFAVPTLVETPHFKLVPLGPAVAQLDFTAYMSSIEHLQKTFSRSTRWPHPGITDADVRLDIETEQGRFRARKSFAYSVLTPDGAREIGSVYVSPSPVPGYDAMVRMWVTKADYDAGLDAELSSWTTGWIQSAWPFRHVAYPGRAIAWEKWDALAAGGKKP